MSFNRSTILAFTAFFVSFHAMSFSAPTVFAEEVANPPADGKDGAGTATEWQPTSSSAGNRPTAGGSSSHSFREGPTGGIWQRTQLLGDALGIRSALGKLGVSFTIQETSELLGNVTGGIQKGFTYDGLTTMTVQVDTKRAFNLYGGLFNVSGLQVHGVNLSPQNLGTLQTASGIEADNGTRLWELWYQQMFFYNQIDVKIGQQSLDQEFMNTQYGGLFVNTMFGWPMLPSADLLSGGPAYPLSSLGVRFRYQPSGEPWSFLLGVFDDNPSGITPGASDDPQQLDNHGTNFRLKDKPLLIGEVQFSRPAIGQIEYADQEPILQGTYKLGFWYDFGQYADQEYGTDGLSLADPASNGNPRLHKVNYSIYGVIDQLVWRESTESAQGIGVFVRAMGGPGDENLIDYSINAGVSWHAPFHHREYDVGGLGFGRAHVSRRAAALDQDTNVLANTPTPVRGSETFAELTYQYQVVPWWQLQPDVQYVFQPGATGNAIPNELVIGLRTNISF